MENDNVVQDQDVADDVVADDTEVYDPSKGIVIDDKSDDDDNDDDTTDDADEGEDDSDDADEGDQDSDESKKEPTKEEKISHAFQKKQVELKEEKEARAKAEAKIAELNQKLVKFTTPVRPTIPEIPDTFDPEYATKMKARDEAIVNADRFDRTVIAKKNEIKRAQQDAITKRTDYIKAADKTFAEKAVEYEIDKADLAASDKVVSATLGKGNGAIAEHILTHDQGPLILMHLGKNDLDREKLAAMTIANAGAFIAQEIVPKLSELQTKNKKSKAPKPARTFSGRKTTRSKDPFLKGATFE